MKLWIIREDDTKLQQEFGWDPVQKVCDCMHSPSFISLHNCENAKFWLYVAKELMVLDLEGTDSAERKQNRSNFERQTSLMALTLSEVLIINMWASDIGRSTGMNVDTLRAILEANLRLFAPNSKTLLLFLIREQSPDETQFGVTPSSQLKVRSITFCRYFRSIHCMHTLTVYTANDRKRFDINLERY